jgi:ribosomal protein S18 acetylase RimI-like enzyme
MEHHLNIREYIPGDFAEINQLWNDTGMGNSARADNADTIERTLNAGGKLFVLENSSSREIIGTSWLTHDQRRIYLHHFAVKPANQGKGYAHRLMKESMEFAQSTGMQIKLEVHKDNLKAVELYKKWGFKYLGDYNVYIIRDYNSLPKIK